MVWDERYKDNNRIWGDGPSELALIAVEYLQEHNLATKIVLLTGLPLDEGELEGLRSQGLGGWLLKPLSIERLSQVVAQALEQE